jgi:hypothetical protein
MEIPNELLPAVRELLARSADKEDEQGNAKKPDA